MLKTFVFQCRLINYNIDADLEVYVSNVVRNYNDLRYQHITAKGHLQVANYSSVERRAPMAKHLYTVQAYQHQPISK